jgi:hypothetical protein
MSIAFASTILLLLYGRSCSGSNSLFQKQSMERYLNQRLDCNSFFYALTFLGAYHLSMALGERHTRSHFIQSKQLFQAVDLEWSKIKRNQIYGKSNKSHYILCYEYQADTINIIKDLGVIVYASFFSAFENKACLAFILLSEPYTLHPTPCTLNPKP